jgi:hypothetical protein
VNSAIYFGDTHIGVARNAGDIVVLGGKLFLGAQGNYHSTQWTDTGLIKAVGTETEVLGGGTVSAGGTMTIRSGSLSGSAPLEDDGSLNSTTPALIFHP